MVSKIQLPKLNPKEEAAVTSSTIDVFYVPKKRPPSSIVGDIARSLNTVIPALKEYERVEEEIDIKEEEAKADKDFMMNNKADFKELVKNGTIQEGANPYYIKRYVKNHLRETARTFETELYEAYRKNNLDVNTNPSAFTEFYKSFATDFRDKNNLGAYDAQSLADGFIPYAEASRSNLNNTFIQQRISNIEKNQVETLSNFVEGELIISTNISEEDLDKALANFPNIEGLGYIEKNILFKSQLIQNQIDLLIEDGMNPTTANKAVVDSVIQAAKLNKDRDLLLVLDNIVTDKASGARLAGAYSNEIGNALKDIAQLELVDFKNKQYVEGIMEAERKEEVFAYFLSNPKKLLNLEQEILAFNISVDIQNKNNEEAIANGEFQKAPRLSPDEITGLYSLSELYYKNLTKEFIIPSETGDLHIKEITQLLATEPNNPIIVDMILEGWDKSYYTTAQGMAFFDKYSARSKIDDVIYRSDLRFNQVFDSFNAPIDAQSRNGVLSTDLAAIKELGNQQLLDFYYGLLIDLEDEKFLAQQGLVTQNQKLNYVFNSLRDEAARISQIIIPTNEAFNILSTDEFANRKSEITGNPYGN